LAVRNQGAINKRCLVTPMLLRKPRDVVGWMTLHPSNVDRYVALTPMA